MEDPFDNLPTDDKPKTAKKTAAKKTTTAVADATDAVTEMLADFIAEMTFEEEDFEQAEAYVSRRYIKPAHGTWFPGVIVGCSVEERTSRLVVAYAPNGQRATMPKMIDALVAEGAEEIVEEVTFRQFKLEVQHAATCFGERPTPFYLWVPVFDQRVPYRHPRKGANGVILGFTKDAGRRLIAATQAVAKGGKLRDEQDALEKIAEVMVGKTIMVQCKRTEKDVTNTKPRVNEDGTKVTALVDETEGSFIRLVKSDDGSFVYKDSDVAYEGDTDSLIPFQDDYLIPGDGSDNVATVKEITKEKVSYDNLEERVTSIPPMRENTQVHRLDGTQADMEITWDSVGFIATKGIKPTTMVQGLLKGGELITATWLGTHWSETPKPHELVVTEDGTVQIIPVQLPGAEPSADALDVFKGDQ